MQVISDYEKRNVPGPSAVAIGFFDGVHLGHQAVIRELVRLAGERHLTPCVLTFHVTPQTAPKPDFSFLTQPEEQEALLAGLGVEVLYRPDFERLSGLSPADTVTVLLAEKLKAALVTAGEDLRFGRGAAGDAALLRSLGGPLGIETVQVPVVPYDGRPVSSTRIRQALRQCMPERAAAMLGRPFSFSASVTDGAHLGRSIGFPTINQPIPEGMTLPAFGVYYTAVQMNGLRFRGVTNVGIKPTVGGRIPLAETNLLDVSGDYYGRRARLELLRFVRPEKKFGSLTELAAQIQADRAGAEAWFAASDREKTEIAKKI